MRKSTKMIIKELVHIRMFLEDIRKLLELERKRNLEKDLNISLILKP